MKILLLPFLAFLLEAQSLTVTQFFYDGSNNLRYACVAPSTRPYTTPQPNSVYLPANPVVSIAAGTLTNIVVSGGTATATVVSTSPWNAGTYADMDIVVSGSATAALNGEYRITSGNTNTTTFTFATSAGAGTYTDTNLQVSTVNPLLTVLGWNLTVFTYNGSNYSTGAFVVNSGYTLSCAARSNY